MRIADLSVFQAIVFLAATQASWAVFGGISETVIKNRVGKLERAVLLLFALAAFLFPFFLAYYAY